MEIIDKIIKSKNQPKQTNVTWVDLSGETPVEKHFINGRWVAISSGGSGGTTDYLRLNNKPSINGVELDGNKTSQDLGVYSKPSSGIPESDLSSDVQQALQKHFKGWYDSSSNLPANPVVGDYAYVKGAESTDPAAIYECTTEGSWSDSGRTADTSNVQTFASGEEVNETYIDNDFVGGTDKIAGAEEVKELANEIINKNTTVVSPNNSQSGTIGATTGSIIDSNSTVNTYTNIGSNNIFLASGRQGLNNAYCSIGYYNGDTFLGYEKRGGDGVEAATNFVDFQLTVPPTTDTIKVVGNLNAQAPELKSIVLTSKIDEIVQSVDELEQSVSDIGAELAIEEDVVANVVYEKKQISLNGDLVSTFGENERVAEFLIVNSGSIDYYASGRRPSSGYNTNCSVAYYREDGFCLGYELQGSGTSATNFVDYKLNILPGTAVVRIYGNVNAQAPALRSVIENAVGYLNDRINDDVTPHPLKGKKIAVIGDSISTIQGFNTPYWLVKDIDVGQTIQSYVTWEDVYGNSRDRNTPTEKTIGGVLLTESMIDGELHSFTPVLDDVDKEIGVPHWYSGNTTSVKNWSQVLCDTVGATLLANASSSGSAITSMEAKSRTATTNGLDFICQQAWHPYTIGRCHVRDDAGAFVNPDVIFVYRGTNDFSYIDNGCTLSIEDIDILTNGFDWITDEYEEKKFNFVAGYYLTIKALREAYPKAVIVCCTLNVFKRVVYDKWPTRNGYFTLPALNDCIRKIANITGCGLVEFDKDGITFENCYSEGYITDNTSTPTHPNSKGLLAMGNKAYIDTKNLAIL